MKILHIYPKTDAQLAHYVSMLTTAMENLVEARTATEANSVAATCKEWQPDIIHLHGAMPCQLPKRSRTVISPHGATVSQKAYVVIARSPIEKERLSDRCQRIEIVSNPIITRTTSADKTARQVMEIYQRVMDSNVRELMSEATREALRLLLKVGISGDRRWACDRTLQEGVNWRQLYIYARQEGVSQVLQRGARAFGETTPVIDTEHIKTYLPDHYQQPKPMKSGYVPTLLDTIAEEIGSRQLSLCRMAELHQALMSDTLDEEKLMSELDTKHRKLLSSLLQVASEETLLDEGFMPTSPVSDHTTRLIRNLINRHLEI